MSIDFGLLIICLFITVTQEDVFENFLQRHELTTSSQRLFIFKKLALPFFSLELRILLKQYIFRRLLLDWWCSSSNISVTYQKKKKISNKVDVFSQRRQPFEKY